jgi:predicted GIY-YIG superfamily endonuclease
MYNRKYGKMKNVKIYKITNSVNGMIYIGKTKRDISIRWKQHCNDAKNPLKRFRIHDDILKYGADNFKCEIIDEAQTDEEACEKEACSHCGGASVAHPEKTAPDTDFCGDSPADLRCA